MFKQGEIGMREGQFTPTWLHTNATRRDAPLEHGMGNAEAARYRKHGGRDRYRKPLSYNMP